MTATILRTARYLADYLRFRRALRAAPPRLAALWRDRMPCLHDATAATHFDRHYVYHPAWAARIVAARQPAFHVDISSTLHFASMLSAFLDVRFYDYRPARLELSGLSSGTADLLALPFEAQSLASLSCMHVVEHIGLGRYGEPIDPDGDIKAARELQRMLAPGGTLLFVVPVGRQRIMFNAHRIYQVRSVLAMFPELALQQFALVPDREEDGGLIVDPPHTVADAQEYGCGCFWFLRPTSSGGRA